MHIVVTCNTGVQQSIMAGGAWSRVRKSTRIWNTRLCEVQNNFGIWHEQAFVNESRGSLMTDTNAQYDSHQIMTKTK